MCHSQENASHHAQTGTEKESLEEIGNLEEIKTLEETGKEILTGKESMIGTLVGGEIWTGTGILEGIGIEMLIEVEKEIETLVAEIETWTEGEIMKETGTEIEIEIEVAEIETDMWTEKETGALLPGNEVGKVTSIGMSSLYCFLYIHRLSETHQSEGQSRHNLIQAY